MRTVPIMWERQAASRIRSDAYQAEFGGRLIHWRQDHLHDAIAVFRQHHSFVVLQIGNRHLKGAEMCDAASRNAASPAVIGKTGRP